MSRSFGLEEVGDFWEQVLKINNWQQDRIYKIVISKLFGNLVNKKLAILGFSFKSNTNDTRESPAINLCKKFLLEGAKLSIHDPKVTKEQIDKDLQKNPLNNEQFNLENNNFEKVDSVYDAIEKSDAVILVTEWEYYKNLYHA